MPDSWFMKCLNYDTQNPQVRLSGLSPAQDRLLWTMEDQVSKTFIRVANIVPGLSISLSFFWKPMAQEERGFSLFSLPTLSQGLCSAGQNRMTVSDVLGFLRCERQRYIYISTPVTELWLTVPSLGLSLNFHPNSYSCWKNLDVFHYMWQIICERTQSKVWLTYRSCQVKLNEPKTCLVFIMTARWRL